MRRLNLTYIFTRYLLNKNPKADIRVFILNPALFLKLLSIDDELHTLFKANVNFSLPDDNTCIYSNSIIVQSELFIDSKTFNNLKSRLINFLDNNFANDYFNKTTKKLFDKNIKENFELLKNEKALTQEILDKYPKEIMITASGPSLEDNIETVRELHNCGVLLIAAVIKVFHNPVPVRTLKQGSCCVIFKTAFDDSQRNIKKNNLVLALEGLNISLECKRTAARCNYKTFKPCKLNTGSCFSRTLGRLCL